MKVTQLALLASLVLVRPATAPASAELVLFTNGQTLSVNSYVFEGDQAILQFHDGGELVCDRSIIVRIEPDNTIRYQKQAVTESSVLPPLAARPARPFSEIVNAASMRHGVNPNLVYAVIEVESAYRPGVRSPKGAMGLMQLMPTTVKKYSVTNPFDPTANIEAGTRHLRSLLDRYEIDSALAAYNAGEGSVRKFGGVPPYPETRKYVAKILGLVDAAQDR